MLISKKLSLAHFRGPIVSILGLFFAFIVTIPTIFSAESTSPIGDSTESVLLRENPDSTSPPTTHLQLTSTFPDDSLGVTPDTQTGSEFPSLQNTAHSTDFISGIPKTKQWIEDQVRKGDTFVKISLRNGLSYQQALNVANAQGAEILHRIKPDQTIRFQLDSEQQIDTVQYAHLPFETLEISRDKETGIYRSTVLSYTPDKKTRSFRGTIETSVFHTAQVNNIPSSIINDLIRVYQRKVDFYRDINKQDEFSIIYEELYRDGKKIGTGKLIAAEIDLSGDKIHAIQYTDPDGHTDYYSPDGQSLSFGFLRSPLEFATVSSHFSPKRLHPVTKEWKPHRGVDYSAPLGTPVMATGDGRVIKAKRMNGYGITVVIKHNDKYQSLYAHLSKIAKGVGPGTRVKQGEIIGYVGSTGMSTGPHLHYEFQVDGIHQNAVTVKLPNAKKVKEQFMPAFNTLAENTLRELSSLESIQVATNG